MSPSNQRYSPSLERLSGATTKDGARLDVAANGFLGDPFMHAFFGIRVFNPHGSSNRRPLSACYRKHKNI